MDNGKMQNLDKDTPQKRQNYKTNCSKTKQFQDYQKQLEPRIFKAKHRI
jgi:hypothetical protein